MLQCESVTAGVVTAWEREGRGRERLWGEGERESETHPLHTAGVLAAALGTT